jgi:hypothetical protein
MRIQFGVFEPLTVKRTEPGSPYLHHQDAHPYPRPLLRHRGKIEIVSLTGLQQKGAQNGGLDASRAFVSKSHLAVMRHFDAICKKMGIPGTGSPVKPTTILGHLRSLGVSEERRETIQKMMDDLRNEVLLALAERPNDPERLPGASR